MSRFRHSVFWESDAWIEVATLSDVGSYLDLDADSYLDLDVGSYLDLDVGSYLDLDAWSCLDVAWIDGGSRDRRNALRRTSIPWQLAVV